MECKVTPHLFLVREVLRNIEHVTDFLRRLALDHISDGLAAHITDATGQLNCEGQR